MNAFFDKRKDALKLIKDIRTVRKIIHSAKFSDRMFDAINGEDRALENLIGKEVLTAFMDESDLTNIRREVLNKLTENEMGAFDLIRETLESYFADIDKTLANYVQVDIEKVGAIAKAGLITDKAKSMLANGVTDTGLYTKNRLENALEAFGKVSEFLDRITPVMQRVLDESEEVTPEEGSTAAEPEKIEETEIDDPNHKVFENPPSENEAAMTEIIAACARNVSMQNCIDHFDPNGGHIVDFGYASVEDLVNSVKKIHATSDAYIASVKKFRDVLPVATCVADELNRGSDTFFAAVEAVMNLINKAENVRDRLDQTSLTLIDAIESLERGC